MSNILKYSNEREAFIRAIENDDVEAIFKYLGNDKHKWTKFSNLVAELVQYTGAKYMEELPDIYQDIVCMSKFEPNKIPVISPLYNELLEYVSINCIDDKLFAYMLDRNITQLYMNVMSYFNDYYTEVDDLYLAFETILEGTKYTMKDMPLIMYNLATQKNNYNSFDEFINEAVMHDVTKADDTVEEYFTLCHDTILFKLLCYSDNQIFGIEVSVEIDDELIGHNHTLVDIVNIIRRSNLRDILLYGPTVNDFSNLLDKTHNGWDDFISAILGATMYDDSICSMIDNESFVITKDMLIGNDLPEDLPDNIKLKVSMDLIPYVVGTKTNEKVLVYLINKLLRDIFGDKYKTTKEINTSVIIKGNNHGMRVIREICDDEGIKCEKVSEFRNLLMFLCTEAYTFNRNLSSFGTLGEYYKYFDYKEDIKTSKYYTSQDVILKLIK